MIFSYHNPLTNIFRYAILWLERKTGGKAMKAVKSTWDTGRDGEPRRGVLIEDCGMDGGVVRWDDGEEESVDRSDIIIRRKEK